MSELDTIFDRSIDTKVVCGIDQVGLNFNSMFTHAHVFGEGA